MSLPVSRRQLELLNAFLAFTRTHRHAPSVRELARLLDRAPSTVHQALSALREKGLLENQGGAHGWRVDEQALSRAARPAPPARGAGAESPAVRMVEVPIRGTIAAGRPIEAIDLPDDVLLLPEDRVPAGSYALRVAGESMVEDHILDGDLVLVRPRQDVEEGRIAVALLEDGSATLKRIYRDRQRRRIRLQPANADLAPLFVESVRIQGEAIGVFRSFSAVRPASRRAPPGRTPDSKARRP